MDLAELVILLSSCCLCVIFASTQNNQKWDDDKFKEEAGQTFNLIFHKYNPLVRPPQEFVIININVTLRHIRFLDLRKQELQTVLDIEMDWHDSRLSWNPDRMPQIFANRSIIWSPDDVFTNSVAASKELYPSILRVNHKGEVYWIRKEVVTTYCPTDLGSDTQTCTLALGFMSSSRSDRPDRFFSNASNVSFTDEFWNHDWELKEADVVFNDDDSNSTVSMYSSMDINLHLGKRGEFEVMTSDGEDDESTYSTTSDDCTNAEEMRADNPNTAIALGTSFCWAAFMTSVALASTLGHNR